jgi:hypothetical protein
MIPGLFRPLRTEKVMAFYRQKGVYPSSTKSGKYILMSRILPDLQKIISPFLLQSGSQNGRMEPYERDEELYSCVYGIT